jgi:Zn-dependent M28 family amino/carboxypeptidase
MKACDNIAAVGQLAADFSKLGLRAATTRVQYPGSGYFPRNVEAKLDSDINPEAVVLITAHLDSTAKKDTNYRPAQDDAPGADDDASGIAAVLACAEALRAVRGNTISKAAIRLVCFNVEEDGFNGSRAFAKGVAASGVLLLGVLQLDMLGYPAPVIDGTQAFEVHAGHSNADVQQWSSALGAIVCELAQRSASGLGGRLYPRGACSDAGNGSSDHASFQNCGWGACAISEAFFGCVEAPSEPPYRNPNYHTSSDTSVDVDYAAAIARVVAASAIKIADAYDSCH